MYTLAVYSGSDPIKNVVNIHLTFYSNYYFKFAKKVLYCNLEHYHHQKSNKKLLIFTTPSFFRLWHTSTRIAHLYIVLWMYEMQNSVCSVVIIPSCHKAELREKVTGRRKAAPACSSNTYIP